MKQIICIVVFSLLALNFIQAKQLPDFVQKQIDSVKAKTRKSLIKYRYWDTKINGYRTIPYLLSQEFSDKEVEIINGIDLNLNIGMIYDDEMRNRIVQLMRNEYMEDELDTLVNRFIEFSSLSAMREAFADCKFDTLRVFIEALDNFYTDIINKNPGNSVMLKKYEYARKYQYVDTVFKLLHLDTTTLYKQSYDKIVEKRKDWMRQDLLHSTGHYRDYVYLGELCGYINDKRFIQPLIDILNNPLDIDSTNIGIVHKTVIEALARMRVEPYYSDYVKKRTLTPEQIKDDKWLDFKIEDFVYVLGTQKSFLELSKYLLSNKPYSTIVTDYEDHTEYRHYPVSDNAFILIRDNIENSDLQEMIGKEDIEDYTPYLKPLYDWMQKNYGKYKIRRIW